MMSSASATSVLASSARAQGCEEAIRPAFTRLVETGEIELATAIGPQLPEAFEPLVTTAVSEGSSAPKAPRSIKASEAVFRGALQTQTDLRMTAGGA